MMVKIPAQLCRLSGGQRRDMSRTLMKSDATHELQSDRTNMKPLRLLML